VAKSNPRLRPLLIRPGARHACAGDGLCCTDAHVLGPVSPREAARARAIVPTAITRSRALGIAALATVGHGCVFLEEGGCRLHREHGAGYKPATCRHFPLALVATPRGGRVTTDHRCPCRTMGARPLLGENVALAALTDERGRLLAHARIGASVLVARGRRVPFARYAAREETLRAALASGVAPEDVLAVAPFPRLAGISWGDVAHHLRSKLDGTSAGDALAWAGDAILSLSDLASPALRARPWSPAFDRAERRAPEAPAAPIFGDWVADELWSMPWPGLAPFDAWCAGLATQVAIARWVAARLASSGARLDRAAAEGVLVGELCARAPLWASVVAAIEPP
jgi:Fe-S-cluster containining protein